MWRPLLHRLMYGVVTSSSAVLAGPAAACPAAALGGQSGPAPAAENVDDVLHGRDGGVESALLYAKAWSKYTKELLAWVDKRLGMDIECAKSYAKMAESAKNLASQQEFMPFRDIYMSAFRNDVEYSQVLLQTAAALQSNKFMQPLQTRKGELDRLRKDAKEQWNREQKKMNEAESALKKARLLQAQRLEEHDKAKLATGRVEEELAASGGNGGGGANSATVKQLEKRRRLEDEALQKAEEAREHCKACEVEVGERRLELARVKMEVITTLREMVFQCDLTLKAVTVNWFQLQQGQVVSLPVNHQTLCENAKLYEPGQRYVDFIRGLPAEGLACDAGVSTHSTGMIFTKRALTASLSSHAILSQGSQGSLTSDLLSGDEVDSPGHMTRSAKTCNSGGTADIQGGRVQGPFRPWSSSGSQGGGGGGGGGMCSDSESAGGSSESRSMDSPTASPGDFKRRLPRTPSTGTMSSADDLDEREPHSPSDNGLSEMVMETSSSPGPFRNTQMSKAAQTHRLRKLRAPSKCRECDSLVVFHGAECEECSLACHKKCLETLAIQCGHKKLAGRLHLFGIDFTQAARDSSDGVPFIVRKCTSEIENRALNIKGIYRVNGAKSRVEKLCQAFENGKDLVELSDLYPHDISNVLKLYLRQLPEPLILYRYYSDFIGLAKEAQRVIVEEVEASRHTSTPLTPAQVGGTELNRVLFKLKDLLRQLPPGNYRTLQFLLEHLHRVTERAEENKMTASNLGIIFGPTLIKPRQADQAEVSLSSLVDYPYQALMVELMIRHYQMVFDAPLSPLGGTPAASPRLTAQDKLQQLSRHSKSTGDIKESSKVYKRHSSAVPSAHWLAEVEEATPPGSEGRGFEAAPADVDSEESSGRVNGVHSPGGGVAEVQSRTSSGGGGGLSRSGRVHLRHHPHHHPHHQPHHQPHHHATRGNGKLSSSRPLSAPGGRGNSADGERNDNTNDDSIEEASEASNVRLVDEDDNSSSNNNNKPPKPPASRVANAHRYRSAYIDTQTLRRTWDRQYKHGDVAKSESAPPPPSTASNDGENTDDSLAFEPTSGEELSRSVPSFSSLSGFGGFGESSYANRPPPPQYALTTAAAAAPTSGRRTLRREDNVDGPYSPVTSPTAAPPHFRAPRTLLPPPGTFYKPPTSASSSPGRRIGGNDNMAAENKAAAEKKSSSSASAEDEEDEDDEEDEELGVEIELSVDEPLEDEEEEEGEESPSSSPEQEEEEEEGGGGASNQANRPLYQRLRPRRLQEVEHREAHFV